jgi:hypothetical protein
MEGSLKNSPFADNKDEKEMVRQAIHVARYTGKYC